MACNDKQEAVTKKANALIAQLSEKSQDLATDIKNKSKDIDPNVDTTGPDAWVGGDIDIRWERVDFSLPIPEVTIIDQKWILDLPQVTIKDQEIIFHTPSVRMKMVKTGEYPETTCRIVTKDIGFGVKIDVPECTTTWSPIYMDLPEPFMQEQRIIIGIPEFKMDRVELILGIPEFKMTTQHFILDLPQVTVKNIKVEAKKAQEKGEALSKESRVRGMKLTEEFKENAKLELGQDVKELFYCYEQDLIQQKNSAMKSLEDGVNLLQATIATMVANKVPDDNGSLKNAKSSLKELTDRRVALTEQIEKNIADLHTQQKTFFEKLIGAG
jgi:hypothetical protein